MLIDERQLLLILPNARPVTGVFLPVLDTAMADFGIDTLPRIAAFIAQVGHESAQLTRCVESLTYSAQRLAMVWPRRFRSADGSPTALAREVAYQPERIANLVYAGRNGNGDEASGDGWRFRGRGLLQVTGRSNYRAVGEGLAQPFVARPQLLAEPRWACRTAAWWWQRNGLNELADGARFEDITRRINGGLNGLEDRARVWRRALEVLG
ncbi:glycoside hydrolase family 19 protein [Pseudomonas nicosulfuronedens]|uniref:Glycoside hydrolase family 19 protein n=1 Tax=Pseudomonas nicosulfuronedens TaxID=2571105 RepID=A0A5R9QSV5_9PSED|nr:glycoside hydrolase family 19 protein [Pseudomonas nicosulfuronedens]MDH1012547.1 glycoside hydrolase family 19 protein [Pseudomonas nicosulfuronedens]MDH1981791.1 glycoside hydrolase family 19 protein [Pseudomonas nicosulfuronedens]MDH2029990.1 glycoside hydrolase family 19 protein [Pseudomonas nicosulfuronedens]TLX72735.1 glycoside hydrolase family 19 protein [Pseudomonas nicosulfuronedens]